MMQCRVRKITPLDPKGIMGSCFLARASLKRFWRAMLAWNSHTAQLGDFRTSMEMTGEVSKQTGEKGHSCKLQWPSGELRKAKVTWKRVRYRTALQWHDHGNKRVLDKEATMSPSIQGDTVFLCFPACVWDRLLDVLTPQWGRRCKWASGTRGWRFAENSLGCQDVPPEGAKQQWD